MNIEFLTHSTVKLAQQAGAKILEFYAHDSTSHKKSDASPVTAADLAAHQLISQGLKQLTPDLPVLSEEGATIPFAERSQWQRYWLVDPLDGTRDFLEKNGEFTVNIALIDKHQAILGVIYAPALATCYFASQGHGAFKQIEGQPSQKITTRAWHGDKARVVASRHHGSAELAKFLETLKDYTVVQQGSALKFCIVAEGLADVYPRLSPTCEWDSAAGQCIVEQAGGAVVDLQGRPLEYNSKESLQNPSFLVMGDRSGDWLKFIKLGN